MRYLKTYIQLIKESNSTSEINPMIDYTLLEPSATESDIIELCSKADKLGVKSVCVLPKMVRTAAEALEDSKVLVCTVISFPQGTNSLSQKISECKKAISDGADEVDMVLNYTLLKRENTFNMLVDEVKSLVDICHSNKNKDNENIILKVIVESGLLSEEETKIATEVCEDGGADFIKTSTGKVPQGAELNKVKVMYDTIKNSGSNMKIKASGGVRTMEDITTFKPYVDRFGMGFASVDKINGLESTSKSTY